MSYKSLEKCISDLDFKGELLKIKKEDLLLNILASPKVLLRKIKAFSPKPGAFTFYRTKRVKLFGSRIAKINSSDHLLPGYINYKAPALIIIPHASCLA